MRGVKAHILTFTFCGYNDDAFFWEIVIFSRKMLLNFVIMFGESPRSKCLLGLFVFQIALILHFHTAPYRHKIVNLAEGAALVTTSLILYLALMMIEEEHDGNNAESSGSGIIAWMLTSLILVSCSAYFVFLVFFTLKSRGCLTRFGKEEDASSAASSRNASPSVEMSIFTSQRSNPVTDNRLTFTESNPLVENGTGASALQKKMACA